MLLEDQTAVIYGGSGVDRRRGGHKRRNQALFCLTSLTAEAASPAEIAQHARSHGRVENRLLRSAW
jgi:hypothetical protein